MNQILSCERLLVGVLLIDRYDAVSDSEPKFCMDCIVLVEKKGIAELVITFEKHGQNFCGHWGWCCRAFRAHCPSCCFVVRVDFLNLSPHSTREVVCYEVAVPDGPCFMATRYLDAMHFLARCFPAPRVLVSPRNKSPKDRSSPLTLTFRRIPNLHSSSCEESVTTGPLCDRRKILQAPE